MERVISADNLRSFAYVNEAVCEKPIRGIALNFFGLGNMQRFDGEEAPLGEFLGQKGVLYVIPYLNPWAWMNPQAVRQTEEILLAVRDKFGLPEGIPLISTGGSMGGHAALIFTCMAAHTPDACITNCPVCDLPFHYTERPDLPRTLYSAYGTSDAPTLQAALEAASPLHLALREAMPKVKYINFHCTEDKAVNLDLHSGRLMEAMQGKYDVTYYVVPGRGHCQLTDDMWDLWKQHIVDAVTEAR